MTKHYINEIKELGHYGSQIIASKVADTIEDFVNSKFVKPLPINYQTFGRLTSTQEISVSDIKSIDEIAKILWEKKVNSKDGIVLKRFYDQNDVLQGVLGIKDRENLARYVQSSIEGMHTKYESSVGEQKYLLEQKVLQGQLDEYDIRGLDTAEQTINHYTKDSIEDILLNSITKTIKEDRKEFIPVAKIYLKLAKKFPDYKTASIEFAQRLPFKQLYYAFQHAEFFVKNKEMMAQYLKESGIKDEKHPLYGQQIDSLSDKDVIDLVIHKAEKEFERDKDSEKSSQELFEKSKRLCKIIHGISPVGFKPDTVGNTMRRPGLSTLDKDFN